MGRKGGKTTEDTIKEGTGTRIKTKSSKDSTVSFMGRIKATSPGIA
jgi:hypothetical protein